MTNWIIPCNLKYYDVFGAFKSLNKLDWKQSNPNIEPGDMVYIYVGAPVKAICFQCHVTKSRLDHIEIDDSPFIIQGDIYIPAPLHMELQLLRTYDTDELSAEKLAAHGLKGRIMCQRRMESTVEAYINSIHETKDSLRTQTV